MKWHTYLVATVESVIEELKDLTAGELDRVARAALDLAAKGSSSPAERERAEPVPESIVAQAVANGWSAELFTNVIGRVSSDFARPPQSPYEPRLEL